MAGLLELPRGLSPAQLAGGFGWPGEALPGQIEDSFLRRIDDLPEDARWLLVVAQHRGGWFLPKRPGCSRSASG